MKAKKMVGAVALSAALAVGTAMPAFAVPVDHIEGDGTKYENADTVYDQVSETDATLNAETIEDGADGAANTPVFIDVKKSNINVAVPIELRLVAETAGGPLMCPTDGVYAVWNYSMNTPVYINKVEVEYNADRNANGENWTLVQDTNLVGGGVEATTAALGNLYVKLNAPQAVTADSYELDVNTPKVPTAANPWKIERSGSMTDGSGQTTATGTKFPLNFDVASASSIVYDADAANLLAQGNDAGVTAADAFKLKYTISTAKPKA